MAYLSSNISSPFFMGHPISSDNKSSDDTAHLNSDFFVKGDDISEPTSYYQIDEDVYFISGETQAYKFDRKNLKKSFKKLRKHAHVRLEDLDKDNTHRLKSIVQVIKSFYGTKDMYDIVIKDMKCVFSDVDNIKPGTVAAFFAGCYTKDNFPGPVGCNPKCVASIRPSDGTIFETCDDTVLTYKKSQGFVSLNKKESCHAYVYVDFDDFPGFTRSDIAKLEDADIKHVTLIIGDDNGTYKEVHNAVNVSELPLNPNNDTTVTGTGTTTTEPSSANKGAGIAFFVILLALLLILAFVFYRYRKMNY